MENKKKLPVINYINTEGFPHGIPLVTIAILQEYDRKHPENTPGDVGFYHRTGPGSWVEVPERIQAYERGCKNG